MTTPHCIYLSLFFQIYLFFHFFIPPHCIYYFSNFYKFISITLYINLILFFLFFDDIHPYHILFKFIFIFLFFIIFFHLNHDDIIFHIYSKFFIHHIVYILFLIFLFFFIFFLSFLFSSHSISILIFYFS